MSEDEAEICQPVGVPVPVSARTGPVSHAIFRVARLHRLHVGNLLRRVGLHSGQELVMMQLWDGGPQRQTDLARLLGSDAATMTRTLQRLEIAGFVRRAPSPTDKRVTIVAPTAASLALREQVEGIWAELESRTVGEQSPADRAATLRTLELLEENLARAVSANC
ncbi:MarR family winged helix-turn-helix transcriptional regulator [Actinoplanes sp. NPDC051494]|uniref:MarR family winged helix-turn-helix transcriptional regulator n=1 Tax=Actinoplanes sp. NPDC051494 TaxID=3363907 RepID=UPI0037B56F3C